MFKPDFEKAEESEMKLPTAVGSEKARQFQKNIYFCLIHYAKVFVWITRNCGKFFKRWDTRPPDLPPEKSVCRSRSNS